MYLKTIREIAKPQQLAIMDRLKRSGGMTAGALAEGMGMSYMGVKQHLVDLEKRLLVDTWRRPVGNGRPELLYRATERAEGLFPEWGNELSLELLKCAQETYGTSAAERLLYTWFTRRADAYLAKMKGEGIAERAKSLAKLRDADGHCAEVRQDELGGLRVVEFHSPFGKIAEAFPSMNRMDEQLYSRVLRVPVHRAEEMVDGRRRFVFNIPTVSGRLTQAS